MSMCQSDEQNPVSSLNEIVDRVDVLPVLEPRRPEEIIGYDANGLPE